MAITLDATTEKIVATLDATYGTAADFNASYLDKTSTAVTPGEANGTVNGTSETDLVTAPAASTQRSVIYIQITNMHSAAVVATVIKDVSGTNRVLSPNGVSLATKESLCYEHGNGWYVLNASGAIKNTLATIAAGDLPSFTGLTAETTTATGDEFPFYDISATANRKATLSNVMLGMPLGDFTAETSLATGDTFPFRDVSASANRKVTLANLALGLLGEDPLTTIRNNYLINGGFDIAQRQAPGTATTIGDATYGPDRWKFFRQNAVTQYIRVTGAGESGITSRWFGRINQTTATGKFLMAQYVESINTYPLRSRTVRFQISMKANASKTVRMAILELQNAGTADTIPSALVSAWNADTSDPTFGANVATILTESKSVTTTWQTFDVGATVPSNSHNLICAVWSDSAFAIATGTLDFAEAGLYDGDVQREWIPEPISTEFLNALRYCYVLDSDNAGTSMMVGIGYTTSTSAGNAFMYLPIPMRIVPNLTATAADWNFYDTAASAAITALSISAAGSGPRTIQLNWSGGASWTANNPGVLIADTTAGRYLILDAEL